VLSPRPDDRSKTRRYIVDATAAFWAGGAVASLVWHATGNENWAVNYVRTAGTALLLAFPAAAAWFSFRVSHEFSRREPLRAAWRLISLSAFLDFFGQLASQFLPLPFAANPLVLLGWWSPGAGEGMREWGLFLSGPCRFALLAVALYYVLDVYKRAGFLGRFRGLNWPIIGAMAVYVIVEAFATAAAIWSGKQPGLAEVAHYPTDPLLLVLLIEAMLLYRSAEEMGRGLVGNCWKSMGVGVFLVSMGDMLTLATNYGYLPWPWLSIGWYVWTPAAAAFALAPTYQLDAIFRARSRRIEA
jgi:hypothetical protein